MFGTQCTVGNVPQIAEEDLLAYLDSISHSLYFFEAYENSKRLAIDADPNRFNQAMPFSSFITEYLAWLEQGYPLDYMGTENIWHANFLYMLRGWLNSFLQSFIENLYEVHRAPQVLNFGCFVAQNRLHPAYDLSPLLKREEDEFDLCGFPSWLIVDPASHSLGILYDDHLILSSSRSINVVERRYELLFLHEIGHSRLHLNHILQRMYQNGYIQVTSRPNHESQAWCYAHTILMCIVSLRAQIGRLLNAADNAWLLF